MVKPKVSVVCPVYNAEKYLSECLDSIMQQTLKDIEVICINDGSSDKSLEILQKYAAKDSRIKVFDRTNSGAAISRNLGIDLSNGEYLQFTDADDLLEPDMLEGLYKSAKNFHSDVAICRAYDLKKNHLQLNNYFLKSYLIKHQGASATDLAENLFSITNPSVWNKLFRKEFILQNKLRFQNLSSCNDIAFTWISLALANSISYSNRGGYVYRRFSDNVISSIRGNFSSNILKAAEVIRNTLIEKRCFNKFKTSFYEALPYCLRYELKYCNRKQAANFIANIKNFLPNEEFKKFSKYDRITFNLLGFKVKVNRQKTENLLAKLFSYEKSGSKAKLNFLGLKIKLTSLHSDYKSFLKHNVRPNSVLILEINRFHGELLPGVADYFSRLGYQTDFLLDEQLLQENALEVLSEDQQVFKFDKTFCKKAKFLRKINDYQFIYINTHYDYKHEATVFETVGLPLNANILSICHDIIHMTPDLTASKVRFFTLAEYLPLPILNTHRFGNIHSTHKKHSPVNFAIIGSIESKRKNHNLLVEAVEKLLASGTNNFKITVVGKGDMVDSLSDEIKPYFDVKGRLDYPDMYRCAAEADFILALLDPENESHNRYITTATSGNFQLIYGFCKPCLIHQKFAALHGLDNNNSLVYNENSELCDTMIKAIKLSDKSYSEMQKHLKGYVDGLYQKSLSNLKQATEDLSSRQEKSL